MSYLKKAFATCATIGVAGILIWLFSPRSSIPSGNAEPQPSEQAVPNGSSMKSGGQAPYTIDTAVANGAATGSEEEATLRMYVAHVSLREPEVADPDSEANRLILETMVKKALLQDAPAN